MEKREVDKKAERPIGERERGCDCVLSQIRFSFMRL